MGSGSGISELDSSLVNELELTEHRFRPFLFPALLSAFHLPKFLAFHLSHRLSLELTHHKPFRRPKLDFDVATFLCPESRSLINESHDRSQALQLSAQPDSKPNSSPSSVDDSTMKWLRSLSGECAEALSERIEATPGDAPAAAATGSWRSGAVLEGRSDEPRDALDLIEV
jgi:hypothetical protein